MLHFLYRLVMDSLLHICREHLRLQLTLNRKYCYDLNIDETIIAIIEMLLMKFLHIFSKKLPRLSIFQC